MCCVSCHNNQCKQSVSQIPHLYAIFLWLKRKTADILRDLILTLYTTCINSLSVYCSTNKPLNFQRTGHFCSLAVSLCFESCYLHVDTSVVCHVLMHWLDLFLLQDICFWGAKYGKIRCLLAFCIVVPDPAVWLESVCRFLSWIS